MIDGPFYSNPPCSPVVDGDDDDLAPRRQLVAREVVARAVRELAAVDVEHDRQQLRLPGLAVRDESS